MVSMKKTRLAALILAIALLLCACVSKEESAYRAAKKKLEKAQNLWGSVGDEERDATWQEALEALEAVGDYEDAPALADEAREYFYERAWGRFWEIDRHDDALDKAQAYLDRISGYKDASDLAALREALRLTMDGKVEEGAEIARTLPESFDDNLFRNTILMLDDCRTENWTDALEKAGPLWQQTLEEENSNGYLTRKDCMERVLQRSDLDIAKRTSVSYLQTSDGLEKMTNTCAEQIDGVFENILLRYYAQQVDLGNDISKLEFYPCELGRQMVDSPFGQIDLGNIYRERVRRAKESLEAYGVTADYAKVGPVTLQRELRYKMTKNGPVVDGFDEVPHVEEGPVPTPPVEITGSGICFLKTSNHDDETRLGQEDLSYRVEPTCLADSVEDMRYVCRIYEDYTQTYIVYYSTGGQSAQYYINGSVQLLDLVTGETLCTCAYYRNEHSNESNFGEVVSGELLPVLLEIVTIY